MSDVIVTTTNPVTTVTTTDDVTNISITDETITVSVSTAGVQGVPGSNSDPTYVIVRNATGAQLNKGDIVYVSGANGVHTQVTKALATADATSARTLGWMAEDVANNADGLCMVEGYLEGINTQGITEGAQLYLSGTTAGAFTETKPQAPTHLVYVGVAAKASAGNGKVFVKVQNGYEIEELHDVRIVSKQNGDVIRYNSSTNLWENVASTALTVGSAISAGTATYATNAGTAVYATTSGTSVSISGSITKSQVSDFTSGTVTSASTAQQAGTATYATTSGTSVSISGSITKSQVSDFTSGTVTSASTAQTAGTADYATTSGTSVSISGSITKSQVSDFTSGTVASASTAQQAGTATYATTSTFATSSTFAGTATYAASAGSATVAGSAVNANAALSALYAVNAGTANFANTAASATLSGTADYATTSGTALTITGSITQSQVSSLVTDLASKAALGSANTFTVGAQTIQTGGTANIGLVVQGVASQSANLIEIQTSSSTAISVTSAGNLNATGQARVGTTSGLGQLAVVSTGTATIAAVIRGHASQSADLQQWQLGDSSLRTFITANGKLGVRSTTLGDAAANLYVGAINTTDKPVVVRGAASQSANLTEWQDSTGSTATYLTSAGAIRTTGSIKTTALDGVAATLAIQPAATTTVGAVVRGAASQSANLQEWQNSSGGTILSVNSASVMNATRQIAVRQSNAGERNLLLVGASGQTGDYIGIFDNNSNAIASIGSAGLLSVPQASITNTIGTASVPLTVRGIASQSGNLQEWQSSSTAILAKIDSSGNVYGGQLRTTNSYLQALERNTGAEINMARQTATPGVPGANIARLYFVAGTNANTLKLCVRAGATGAETTILDNIPT